ncbi:hypothetical protein ACE1B4_22370 [Aeromonas veronii]|uniref:hypothetical protein n=1 Tax=Aeromonas veronii TaxID=654 RepID=UPI00195C0CB0|nr:hypothetical protein [Aeromonas veronii]HDO1313883.1 hypothetical protein [Aeromonas veronii]
MDKAEMLLGNDWIEVDLGEFGRRLKGSEQHALRCVHCKQAVSVSGLASPTPGFTPRFRHNSLPTGEDCPLGSNSQRFNALAGNENNVNTTLAAQRRAEFTQFAQLRQAYLVCRELLGGKGKLSQTEFLKLLKVADSFGIWRYRYLPSWGIPLLLMLMDNHSTPNGNAAFFYTLQKERARPGEAWERQKIWLAAHWVSNGKQIEPKEGKQPAFQLTIPFTEEAMTPLLAKVGKMDFFTEEKLSTLSTYSKEEAAKCAATKR